MKIGIVGLPNVGKSTLFNALTRAGALAANYPFATIEPNVGVVPVADSRLAQLAEIYASGDRRPRIVPATVTFVDIAGLVAGASEGQGLGNRFLANIRECDAIAQVVRDFGDENVTHVTGRVDAASDIATINTELVLADLETLDKRLDKVKKDAAQRDYAEQLRSAREVLDRGELLSGSGLDLGPLHDLHLLSAKPFVYVFNVDEATLADSGRRAELGSLVAPAEAIFVSANIEAELVELDETDAAELLAELGQEESGLDVLVRAAQRALGLQTFLTAGEKEVRAWTVPIGATAPEAAGVIHTDFQRGFISAEVVDYDELVAAGSLADARAAGRARLEGKEYVMQPADVVEFRFNV